MVIQLFPRRSEDHPSGEEQRRCGRDALNTPVAMKKVHGHDHGVVKPAVLTLNPEEARRPGW